MPRTLMRWILCLPLTAMTLVGSVHAGGDVTRGAAAFKGKLAPALAQAVADGNASASKRLIAEGADINATNAKGVSLLDVAVGMNRPKTFKALLDAGANFTYNGPVGVFSTVVHFAAESVNHPVFLRTLVQRGAPVDIEGNAGMTPLFAALQAGEAETNLMLLLKHGADVNHVDNMGETPLIEAVMGNDYKGALLLLHHGANPNVIDKRGDTFQGYMHNLPEDAYTASARKMREEIRQWLTAHYVNVTF